MRPKSVRARLLAILVTAGGLLFLPSCSINQVGLGAQVDVTPPKLAISGPSADGTYQKGTVTLSGTFTEDVSLKSLAVVYSTPSGDKQKAVPITGFAAKQAVAWTVSLSSGVGGDLSDGANTLTIVATDNSDKVMTQTRLVYVDNTPPTVLVQSPSSYHTASSGLLPLYSDYIDIKGEVYDQSPVRQVQVSLYRTSGALLGSARTAEGTNTFSTRFLLKTAEAGAGAPLLGAADNNAEFRYVVTATDAAGNTNTWLFHRQDIYAALASGTIFPTVDEIGKLDSAGTGSSASGVSFASLDAVRVAVSSPAFNFQYQHELVPRISFVNVSAESTSNILGVGAIVSATIQPPASAGSSILPNTVIAKIYNANDLSTPVVTYTGDGGSTGNQTLTSLGDSVSYSLALKNGSTPLPPGPYVLSLSAQAQGSAVTTQTVSLFIDSGAPYLDKKNTSSTAAFVNTPVTLGGRAVSDVGVQKIEVYQSYNGGTLTLVGTQNLGSATDTTWTSPPLPPTGSPDGVYDYTVTLTTSSSKTTNVYHNLTWDSVKPTVAVSSVNPVVGTNTVNGSIDFSGSATDLNGLKEVRWSIGAAEPADWTTATLLATPPFVGTIDTTTLPDNSDQTFYLRAVDKAGNIETASKTLRVNQSSDNPTIALLNADGSVTGTTVAGAKANLFQNGGKVLGTATDDDGIDPATIEARFDGGSWAPVTKKGAAGLSVSFEQDLSALTDGVHALEFRAADTGGKAAAAPLFQFVFDTTNPTLAVTGAAARDTKTSFSLSGTAADGVSVDAVTLTQSKDGGTAVALGAATLGGPETARTWTFGAVTALPRDPASAATALLADGTYVYTVLATDEAGKTSPLSTVTVRVDRTAPETLTLADPAAGQTGANSLTSKTNVFRGTASDTGVGMATLWYKIDTSASASSGTAGYTAVPTSNGNWSFTDSDRAEGAWYLHLKAEDSAGNVTADAGAVTRAFGIDVAAPVLAETTIGTALAERAAGFDLTGTWTETNGVASFSVTQKKDAGAAVAVTTGFTTGAAWALTGLPRDPAAPAATLPADGTYEYTFTITDAAGKTGTLVRTVKLDRTAPVLTITAPSPSSWSTSGSVTVTGVTTDGLGTGTTLVEASADGTSYAPVSGTASSWNLALSGLAQGQKTLWFRATDAVGNVSTPLTLTFGVDTAPPSVPTETTSPGLTLSRLGFDLGGALADSNALASVTVTQNKDSAGAVDLVNAAPSGTASTWTVTGLPRNPGSPAATLLADGSYEYVVTVTDVAGKTAVLTRTIVVDTTAPTAVVDNPGVYLSGNSASLFGSAADGTGSGVDLVQYSTTSASGPWTAATGKGNWLVSLDLDTDGAGTDPGLTEGSYTLWVQSVDKAGNPSAVASRTFLVDQAAPTLGLFKVDGADFLADTIYENAALALTGTANDSYGIQSVAVSQTKSGGTTDTLAVVLGGGTTSRTWSTTATLGQGEGDYTLVVTLTDLAGRQTTVQKTVVKDSQSPSAPAVTSPAAGTWLSGANFSFAGTAADLGSAGLDKVYYGTGARGLTPPAALTDSFWTAAAGTASWTAAAALTGEGQRSLYFKAVDKAGNVSALQSFDYGIDQSSPNLTFDQPSGSFVNGNFVLSGTASDTNAVASVTVLEKKPGDLTYTPYTAVYAAGTWSYTRLMNSFDGLPDGVYQYQVVVTDAAGKTTVLSKSVTRDFAAPTVGLNAPLPTIQVLGVYQGNGVLTLSGTAADLNGLDNLEIKVGAGAWTVLGTAPFTSFSTTVDTTLQTDGQDLAVAVRATDKAGNTGTSTWTIHVDQASDRPTVTITSPAGAENVQSATISLTATISDDDGVNPAGAEYRLSYNGGSTWSGWTAVPAGNLSGSATAKTLSLSINDPSNGTKLIQVRAADTGAVTGTSPTVTFSQDTGAPVLSGLLPPEGSVTAGASVILSGTATDANAVTSVTYRVLRDGTEILSSTAAGLGADSDPGTGVTRSFTSGAIATTASGNYQIQLESSDGGNTRQETINFTVDRTVPTVSFNSPAALSTQNNKISVTGIAADNRLLSTVALEIRKGGTKVADLPGPVTGTANWSSVVDTALYANATYATFVSGTAWDLTVRAVATDSVGNIGTADLTFRIDQSTDSPAVSVTTAQSPAFIGDLTVSGSASDDDGIASIEVSANGSYWTPLTAPGGGWTKTSSWNTTLAAGDGTKSLYLRVTDTSVPAIVTTTAAYLFQVDTETPDGAFTAPAAAAKLIGTELVFSGTFADESGVTAVKLKADSSDFSSGAVTAAFTPAVSGPWSYTFAAGDLAEGVRTIYLQVTDASGRTSTAARAVTLDKTAPAVTVSEPSSGSSAFGLVRLRGSAVDGTTGVKSVKIGLGKTINTGDWDNALNTWYPATGTVSWEYVISNINSYAGTTYATDLGDTNGNGVQDAGETLQNIWKMYLYIRSEDTAGATKGNVSVVSTYYVEIDPLKDRPEITVLQPVDTTSTVGGFLRIVGSSYDTNYIAKNQIAFDTNNNGVFNDAGDTWPGKAAGDIDQTDASTTAWYAMAGTTSWSQVINNSGEFNPTGGDTTKTIQFKVRAVDSKVANGGAAGLAGLESVYTVTFSNQVPQYSAVSLATGDTVGGTVTLTGYVKVPAAVGMASILFNHEGPRISSSELLGGPAGLRAVLVTSGDGAYEAGYDKYAIEAVINTADADLFANNAGSMTVSLRSYDKSAFQSFQTISLTVDNKAPTAPSFTNLTEIAGTSALVQGTVTDSGVVSGIKKVVFYLQKGSQVYRLKGGTGSLTNAGSEVLNLSNTAYNDYRIVVDKTTEGGNDAGAGGDGDGFNESLSSSFGTYTWNAAFNSTLVADGAYDARFTAFDVGGNSTTYIQATFVANNRPSITGIVLATDLNGDGDVVDAGESSPTISANYATTGYTGRNGKLGLTINTTGGNGTKRFSVVHGGVERNLTPYTNNVLVIDTTGISDSSAANDKLFTIKVYDSTTSDDTDATNELSSSITVGVTIDNIDEVNPTVAIAPFGQKYSASDDDAAKALGAVALYTDNLKLSGTTPLGHVEYAADSLYNGTDADVSGEVIFKGKVADNQRISRITAAIPGFDGGSGAGAEFNLYTYAGGPLTGTGWAFGVDGTNFLTEAKGNVLNWNLTWNSALISTVAANNVVVTIKVYDAKTPTANTATTSLTVDVVPYISALVTKINSLLGKDFNRTALGAYPVWVNTTANTFETLTVNGFNLNPASVAGGSASDLRLSIDADGLDAAYAVKQGSGLLGTAANAARTQLTVQMGTAASTPASGGGYLTVLTNGIPSINNINAAKVYNAEASAVHESLSDDRKLQPWALTTLRTNATYTTMANATYPSMVMNGNTPTFAYVNNAMGYGLAQFWNGTTSAKTYESWDLFTNTALDLNSNGSRAALYDINVVWQGSNDWAGDAGGTMVNFFYDSANTAWGSSAQYYRPYNVWLDNLNKRGNAAILGRYAYPDIAVIGNDALTTSFYTTYDSIDDRILFRTFKVGTNAASVGSTNNLKGSLSTSLYTNLTQWADGGTWPTFQDTITNNKRFNTNGPTIVAATALNSAYVYMVNSAGTSDFTTVGAANNWTGTVFKPTAAGTGTGTAVQLSTAAAAAATGTAAGNYYYVVTTGTTDFTAIGASSSAPGTVFVATGAGSGSGTVSRLNNNNAGASAPGVQVLQTGTGQYSAVDATSTGVAVVSYYKSATNELVYRYNVTPTNPATWSSEIVLDSNVGGDFVDLVIDNSGGTPTDKIHLAYHDSFSGDLKYLQISAYNGTVSGPYRVDSYLTVGNKLGLTLSPTKVPTLAYKGMGNTAKVAWLVGTLGDGTDTDDKFNGVWESTVVPVKIVDSDSNRFSAGVGSDGRPVMGYTNADPTGKGLEYLTKLNDLAN